MQGPMAVWCAKNTAMVIGGWTELATRPVEAVVAGVVPLRRSARVTVTAVDAVVPLTGPVSVAVAVRCVARAHGYDVEA